MNDQLLQLLDGDMVRYPHALEEKFPRILNKIIELWETPDMESYFNELLMDKRGVERQGFPRDVASDIFVLSTAYSIRHQAHAGTGNVWDDIPEYKRQELELQGYDCSPGGFTKAIEAGNEEAVKVFLSCGVDVDARDERDWTPLMVSSFNGNERLAMLLVHCGAKVQAQDKNGYSPLHWAAFNGYDKVVDLLLDKGANVNATSQFGWTALMQAATRGHLIVVARLLAKGAYPNEVNHDGWTALHKAAANGHSQVVKLLLSKGADPTIQHPDGSTALSLALKNKHGEIVDMLNSFLSSKPKHA